MDGEVTLSWSLHSSVDMYTIRLWQQQQQQLAQSMTAGKQKERMDGDCAQPGAPRVRDLEASATAAERHLIDGWMHCNRRSEGVNVAHRRVGGCVLSQHDRPTDRP